MFFWDTASPIFSDKFPPNAGTTFVKFLQEQFSQPDDFTTSRASSFPPVNVWGIPSGVGQAKCAFKIVDDMIAKKVINDPLNAIDTAIVAPDESLLLPLLNSVSNDIKNINNGLPTSCQRYSVAHEGCIHYASACSAQREPAMAILS